MAYDTHISLSLQREIEKRNLSLDSEIQGAFKALRIRSILARCSIVKQRGYSTIVLLYWLLLLPFIMKRLTALWSDTAVSRMLDAKKDAYCRFLNNERFNWVYRLALRIIASCDNTPLKEKTLIIDDAIKEKTGKHMDIRADGRRWVISVFSWAITTESLSTPSIAHFIPQRNVPTIP